MAGGGRYPHNWDNSGGGFSNGVIEGLAVSAVTILHADKMNKESKSQVVETMKELGPHAARR